MRPTARRTLATSTAHRTPHRGPSAGGDRVPASLVLDCGAPGHEGDRVVVAFDFDLLGNLDRNHVVAALDLERFDDSGFDGVVGSVDVEIVGRLRQKVCAVDFELDI